MQTVRSDRQEFTVAKTLRSLCWANGRLGIRIVVSRRLHCYCHRSKLSLLSRCWRRTTLTLSPSDVAFNVTRLTRYWYSTSRPRITRPALFLMLLIVVIFLVFLLSNTRGSLLLLLYHSACLTDVCYTSYKTLYQTHSTEPQQREKVKKQSNLFLSSASCLLLGAPQPHSVNLSTAIPSTQGISSTKNGEIVMFSFHTSNLIRPSLLVVARWWIFGLGGFFLVKLLKKK